LDFLFGVFTFGGNDTAVRPLRTLAARTKIFRMGRTYLFECPKCGYRAKVAGGASDGARFEVQTIECADCRQLHDAVIRLKVALPKILGDTGAGVQIKSRPKSLKTAPPFNAVLNSLPFPARQRTRWQRFRLMCPISQWHRVREWNQPGKCPRCGIFLEASAVPFRIWE
jgi:hypothetical protein